MSSKVNEFQFGGRGVIRGQRAGLVVLWGSCEVNENQVGIRGGHMRSQRAGLQLLGVHSKVTEYQCGGSGGGSYKVTESKALGPIRVLLKAPPTAYGEESLVPELN